MTNPSVPQAWPSTPSMPSAAPAGYVTPHAPKPTPVETPITSAEADSRRNEFYELLLRQVLKALTGFFLPGTSAFDQLTSWADNVPLLSDIVQALSGVPGTIETLADWAINLLSDLSPLNAFNLFGVLNPFHIGSVPGGSVGASAQNLISEPAFRAAITVITGQGWTWDAVEGRTIPGSVMVVADGEQNELVSNEIPVVPDEVINFSVWNKWTSLSYTGTNPISFGITGYSVDPLTRVYTELESVDLASWASPATNSTGWQQLSAAYTVPGLGMGTIPDVIRMRFKISQDLNVGNVWWDEPSGMKPTHVHDSVVPGIGSILNNVVNGLENLAGDTWDHVDAFFALFGQNNATVGLNTRVNYLESLLTTGIQANDLFERTSGTSLGTDWDQTYVGAGGGDWSTPNGHDASWDEAGSATRTVYCKFVQPGTTISNTDNQKIVGVLGSKAQEQYGARGTNILIGRYSADKLNGIFAYFRADGRVSIAKLISGVETEIDFEQLDSGPSSGSSICLLCGSGGTRDFQATINGQIVLECSDSTSNVGASYRGWGHGAIAAGYATIVIWPPPFFASGQASPGLLNSWSAIDN